MRKPVAAHAGLPNLAEVAADWLNFRRWCESDGRRDNSLRESRQGSPSSPWRPGRCTLRGERGRPCHTRCRGSCSCRPSRPGSAVVKTRKCRLLQAVFHTAPSWNPEIGLKLVVGTESGPTEQRRHPQVCCPAAQPGDRASGATCAQETMAARIATRALRSSPSSVLRAAGAARAGHGPAPLVSGHIEPPFHRMPPTNREVSRPP